MKPLCYQLSCKRLWQLQSPRFDFHKHTQVPDSKQIVHTHNGLISTSTYLLQNKLPILIKGQFSQVPTSKQIVHTHNGPNLLKKSGIRKVFLYKKLSKSLRG